ncbi:MAG: glycosyltransferase [Desulfonatronovibrionaceae bacterium]
MKNGHNSLKADLHVHSKYSRRPSQWILQKISCPESFTEPLDIYTDAKKKGMDLVTITDHNRIDGALEIAHLDNTFLSEEITTYFPKDGCKAHILAWDISEKDHHEFGKIRENIHDLILYLRNQNIAHALAHPLFSVNDKLTLEHIEKFLLLFNYFELNGSRDVSQNNCLRRIIGELSRGDVERLANKHEIEPFGSAPWEKGLIGGSDDHSSLNIACMYTEMPEAANKVDFFRLLGEKKPLFAGESNTPLSMARNLYSIAYQFYLSKDCSQPLKKSIFFRFTHNLLAPGGTSRVSLLQKLQQAWAQRKSSLYFRLLDTDLIQNLFLKEADDIIHNTIRFKQAVGNKPDKAPDRDRLWQEFVSQASNRITAHLSREILEDLKNARLFDIFKTIGSSGSLYTLLAPFFISYGLFSREREFAGRCRQKFLHKPDENNQGFRIAHFTDTLEEVNGVALTIRGQAELARKFGKDMTVLHCSVYGSEDREQKSTLPGREQWPGIKSFAPVHTFKLEEYPQLNFHCPPLLEIMDHCFTSAYDLIISATPGPMGLAALAISKNMHIPIHGTYHTSFPDFVFCMTGDGSLEEAARRYMGWYYSQMEMVYAPSQAAAEEVEKLGVSPEKIVIYPRGVDCKRFYPGKCEHKNKRTDTRLIYVGRISREKSLDVLAEAFDQACRRIEGLSLEVVGDGPYRQEMHEVCAGLKVTFPGELSGESLVRAYSGADLFVFPSGADTFGNVVLEAQASGIPVIVTDRGGPRENIIDGETGVIVPADDPEQLAEKIVSLAGDPGRLKEMGRKAREYARVRSLDRAFLDTWRLFEGKISSRVA